MYVMLILNFIIPFVMIVVGCFQKKHPAKNMKSGNGYCTPASQKSRERWDYAQSIAPDIFIGAGRLSVLAEFLLCIILLFLGISIRSILSAGTVVGIIFLISGFYKTEAEIAEKFK